MPDFDADYEADAQRHIEQLREVDRDAADALDYLVDNAPGDIDMTGIPFDPATVEVVARAFMAGQATLLANVDAIRYDDA